MRELADRLMQDSTLPPRDAAELAEDLGVLFAYLQGPAEIPAIDLESAQTLREIQSRLPANLAASLDAGAAWVETKVSSLRTERAALVGIAAEQQQSEQLELARKQGELSQQESALQKSNEQAQQQVEEQLVHRRATR